MMTLSLRDKTDVGHRPNTCTYAAFHKAV